MRKIMKKILFASILPLAVFFAGCNLGDVNGPAEYKVSYYLQNVEDDEYTLLESENFTGYEGEMTKITPRPIEGFTVVDFRQRKISDGMDFAIKYNRNIITCNLNFNGGIVTLEDGTVLENTTVTGRFGAKIEVDEPVKNGYVLDCYYMPDGTELGEIFSKSGTYTASYISKSEASYAVHHFLQNIENDEYTEDTEKLETLTGFTGKKTAAQALEIEGFTAKAFEQKVVAADGSTEINIYYNRNLITFSFNLSGGEGQTSITKKYGSAVTVQNPVKNGAEFSGWTPDLPQTFTEDSSFTAVYDMPSYKVKYLFENLTDDGYSEDENYPEETYLGTVGQTTNIAAKTVKGFVPQTIEQKTVLADNSTVVEIKYDRRLITIFIDLKKGVGTNYIQGKFGQGNDVIAEKLSKLEKPNRSGFKLDENNVYDYSSELEFSLEYNDTTSISVNWVGGVSAAYEVVVFKERLDYDGTGEKYEKADSTIVYGKSGELTEARIQGADTIVLNDKSWKYDYFKPCDFENVEVNGDETTVLNLYFDRIYVKVTFKLNGANINGDTEDVAVKGKYNSRFEMPEQLSLMKRSGYSFVEWNNSFETFPETDVTVVATWKANTYKVILHNNEQIEEKEFTYDQPFVFPTINELSIITAADDNRLIGWSLTEGGEVDYAPETSRIFEKPENVEFYACWSNHYYKIRVYEEKKYDNNTFTYGDPEYNQPTEKTVYTTAGKMTNYIPEEKDGFEIQPFEQKIVSEDDSTIIEIYYNRRLCKIVRNYNGAKDTYNNPNYYYDSLEPRITYIKYGCRVYLGQNLRKTGYTSLKWQKPDGTYLKEGYYDSAYECFTINEDLDLTLCGTLIEYAYKFHNIDNATGVNAEKKIIFTVESDDFKLPTPVLDGGYTFTGWYTDEELTSKYNNGNYSIQRGATLDPSTSIDLYAKWTTSNTPKASSTIKNVGDLILSDGTYVNMPAAGTDVNIDSYKSKVIGVVTHKVNGTWRGVGVKYPVYADSSNYRILSYAGHSMDPKDNTENCTDGLAVKDTLVIDSSYKEYNSNNTSSLGYFVNKYYSAVWNTPATWAANYKTDWYLPAINEYQLMYANKDQIRYSFRLCDYAASFNVGETYWSCNIYAADFFATRNAVNGKTFTMTNGNIGGNYCYSSYPYLVCHELL